MDVIHHAIKNDDLQDLERFLQGMEEPGTREIEDAELLCFAIERGTAEAVRLLLSYGFRQEGADGQNCTPLHRAVIKGDPELVLLLLEQGAPVNRPDGQGLTPLHRAVESSDALEIAAMLIAAGADMEIPDCHGERPLQRAMRLFNREGAGLLFAKGATDPDERNEGDD